MPSGMGRVDHSGFERRLGVIAKLVECLTELDTLGEAHAAIAIDRAINYLTAEGGPLPSDIVHSYLPIADGHLGVPIGKVT